MDIKVHPFDLNYTQLIKHKVKLIPPTKTENP